MLKDQTGRFLHVKQVLYQLSYVLRLAHSVFRVWHLATVTQLWCQSYTPAFATWVHNYDLMWLESLPNKFKKTSVLRVGPAGPSQRIIVNLRYIFQYRILGKPSTEESKYLQTTKASKINLCELRQLKRLWNWHGGLSLESRPTWPLQTVITGLVFSHNLN